MVLPTRTLFARAATRTTDVPERNTCSCARRATRQRVRGKWHHHVVTSVFPAASPVLYRTRAITTRRLSPRLLSTQCQATSEDSSAYIPVANKPRRRSFHSLVIASHRSRHSSLPQARVVTVADHAVSVTWWREADTQIGQRLPPPFSAVASPTARRGAAAAAPGGHAHACFR